MQQPSREVIDTVAPMHDIGLPPHDTGIRNTAHAELRDSIRIPRGGPYEAALVAMIRRYDGANGGVPSVYLGLWVEFRAQGSRWRTAGVTIQDFEAARVARDLSKRKESKPAKGEPARVGGKVIARNDSSLRGTPVAGSGYLLYVRSAGRSGEWVRSRGVELSVLEVPIVVAELKKLAAALKA